jgi:IS30 family transposase
MTLDNGREDHRHYELKELGMDTYFAYPYSFFHRSTNERTNGMIQQYLPKGIDFQTASEMEPQEVVWEINDRPMKCLGFRTPSKVYNSEVENLLGVALRI